MKRRAIAKIVGFISGTVCPVCRPQQNQRIIDNWHKRIHAIKFQSVVAQNRLTPILDEPWERKKHSSRMLPDSGLKKLKKFYFNK